MIKLLLSYIQPFSLALVIFTFSLGASLAHYLGYKIDWLVYLQGQICIILLQICSYFLKVFYDPPGFQDRTNLLKEARYRKITLLQITAMLLTIGVIITVSLFSSGYVNFVIISILGAAFLTTFFHGVPPVRLVYSGYGELVEAFFMGLLTPALAFVLQTGRLNQLIIMISVPLTAQVFARMLVTSLENYPDDTKLDKRTLLIRIGWQCGMNLHHILLAGSYLLFIWALIWDFPWSLAWRGLLTLPVGVYQIYQIGRIAGGDKPGWRLLKLTSSTTVFLTIALILTGLWS